jgi:hypothetical protein
MERFDGSRNYDSIPDPALSLSVRAGKLWWFGTRARLTFVKCYRQLRRLGIVPHLLANIRAVVSVRDEGINRRVCP